MGTPNYNLPLYADDVVSTCDPRINSLTGQETRYEAVVAKVNLLQKTVSEIKSTITSLQETISQLETFANETDTRLNELGVQIGDTMHMTEVLDNRTTNTVTGVNQFIGVLSRQNCQRYPQVTINEQQ